MGTEQNYDGERRGYGQLAERASPKVYIAP